MPEFCILNERNMPMKELIINADINNLEQIDAMIDEGLEGLGMSHEDQIALHIAVEEIYSNIAFYAYPVPPGTVKVRLDYDTEKRELKIQFLDKGIPYDPLKKPDPDITLAAEERQIGGLGIYMVKNSMDQVDYRYEDGWNIFTMKKCIPIGRPAIQASCAADDTHKKRDREEKEDENV